jgi:hypothetical protein
VISNTVGATIYWAITGLGQGFRHTKVGLIPTPVCRGDNPLSWINFGMFRKSNSTHELNNTHAHWNEKELTSTAITPPSPGSLLSCSGG